MTLEQALAHIGNPVLGVLPGIEVRTGEIERVGRQRQLVLVRLRRVRHPYDFTGRSAWYAPCHLRIPEWWRRELEQTAQAVAESSHPSGRMPA
jgi:hypothetical protein